MFALLLACASAQAAAPGPSRRFAVLVGNDDGSGDRPALRYAESDAAHLARALVDVGGVQAGDVEVLQARTVADVEAALAGVRARVAEHHRSAPGARAMLLFYFSGHSDGASLEVGAEHLAWQRLKALIGSTGADVRVGVVDACSSSALLQAGGKVAAPFQIQAEDQLTALGEAYITSSAADETSIESGELKGSLFTSHLIAGLRGAADKSGDKLVSLDELYRYAYDRTAATGAQHPGYGFRLAGHGELILGFLKRGTTSITLPAADRTRVKDAATGEVYADLDAQAARTLVLPAGKYLVEAVKDGQGFTGRVALDAGAQGSLAWNELKPSGPVRERATAENATGIVRTTAEPQAPLDPSDAPKGDPDKGKLRILLYPVTGSEEIAAPVTAAIREALWRERSVVVIEVKADGGSAKHDVELTGSQQRLPNGNFVVKLATSPSVERKMIISGSFADFPALKRDLTRQLINALPELMEAAHKQ